jgi:hypothetical protein
MGLPSLKLDATSLERWQGDLRCAGYSVIEEPIPSDVAEVEKRVDERGFVVQLDDSWVRILEYRKLESGETGLVAMTHQKGCSVELAKRIFAHMNDTYQDDNF